MSPLGSPTEPKPRAPPAFTPTRRLDGYALLALILVGLATMALAPPDARAEQETLLLTTQHWPPYHAMVDGKPQGMAITVLECVLNRLKQPHRIEFLPWRRAQDEVRSGRAHAFFGASRSPDRDQYAQLSAPIAPQTWAWYVPKDSPLSPAGENFKMAARISALAGSNMAQWLSDSGYNVDSLAATTDQLVLMLERKRVDAILANTRVFDHAIMQLKLPATQFRRLGEIERPLGVYFGIAFLARNPGFLARFNAEVAKCRSFKGAI